MKYIKFIIDFILHIDVHLAELVAQYGVGVWVYSFLFLILFCETGLVVTPFLPGNSLLFVVGALALLSSNELDIHVMVLLMVLAVIADDAVNYTIARFVPIVRTFAPFVASMGHMRSAVGSLLLLFSYAGYLFGNMLMVQ